MSAKKFDRRNIPVWVRWLCKKEGIDISQTLEIRFEDLGMQYFPFTGIAQKVRYHDRYMISDGKKSVVIEIRRF
jgi:hypothetical protein